MYDAACMCYFIHTFSMYMHLTGTTNSENMDAPAWKTKGVLQKIYDIVFFDQLTLAGPLLCKLCTCM